jgi:hypothetical protein
MPEAKPTTKTKPAGQPLKPILEEVLDFETPKAQETVLPKEPPGAQALRAKRAVEGAKEPWEMTRDEYAKVEYEKAVKETDVEKHGLSGAIEIENQARLYHPNAVKQALSEKKPVPAEVLKDYPELVEKPGPGKRVIAEKAPPGGWRESDRVPKHKESIGFKPQKAGAPTEDIEDPNRRRPFSKPPG